MFRTSIRFAIQKISYLLTSTNFLTLIFIFLIILIGLGKVNRWDLLDQVAMADNYFKGGSLYPSFNDPTPHGVSVYFPGVALLVIILRGIGLDFYLVEITILLSCLVVMSFFYTLMKISEHLSGERILWYQFIPSVITFCLLVTPYWLLYAIEFKPDTIALFFGYTALITVGFLDNKISYLRLIIGALLFSGAIIFKQQYLALLIGVYAFCLIFPNKSRFLFLFTSVSFLILIMSLLLINPNILYWNFEILANDSFLSIVKVVQMNWSTFSAFILSIVCITFFLYLNSKSFPNINREHLLTIFRSSWAWGTVFFIGASFLSGFKDGGNQGNMQLGILLLFPLIFVACFRLPRFIFICLAWVSILVSLPIYVTSIQAYQDADNLRSFVVNDVLDKSDEVLTGSDVYFASRHYGNFTDSINYWSISLKTDMVVYSSLSKILPTVSPDRLIVENWPTNKIAIDNDLRYEIIFENNAGIIAKRIL